MFWALAGITWGLAAGRTARQIAARQRETHVYAQVAAAALLALAAWLAGTAASLLFVNYANLFGNVVSQPSFFNDGLIRGLHGADVSGLVSICVAAVVYAALRRT